MTPVKSGERALTQELTDRLLAGEALRRSPRLRALFSYLAEHSLNDERGLLSEQQIGIAVFGRTPGFSASEDSVVRVQVHNLRERLAEYFAGEGAAEPVVISIPKGRYRLVFAPRAHARDTPAEIPGEDPARAVPTWIPGAAAWAMAVLIVAALLLAVGNYSQGSRVASPDAERNPILASVFNPGKDTLIVIEDMMLVAASVIRGEAFSLADYLATGSTGFEFNEVFAKSSGKVRAEWLLTNARSVNLANATFAVRLLRSYPHLSERAVFRHPREIQMRDIRASNCILCGGQLSDPWVDLYEDSLNFHLQKYSGMPASERSIFENRRPRSGEAPLYGDRQNVPGKATYARIALVPNFDVNTRTLILTGMGGAETEAAAEFLLASDFVQRLPSELRARLDPLPPHVEILLRTSRVGTTAGRSEVVAWRAGEN